MEKKKITSAIAISARNLGMNLHAGNKEVIEMMVEQLHEGLEVQQMLKVQGGLRTACALAALSILIEDDTCWMVEQNHQDEF